MKDALAMRLRLQAQEPLVPAYNGNLARVLWTIKLTSAETDAALRQLESSGAARWRRGRHYSVTHVP
jgi:hypothetical protein